MMKPTVRTNGSDIAMKRIGALRAVMTIVFGVVALNLIAAYSQPLAVIMAASVIALAIAVFAYTLFRK